MKRDNSIYIIVLGYLIFLVAILAFSILLSGCSTQRRFDNIVRRHPDIGYSWCANKFDDNVIPVYLPGDTITVSDTVKVDCGDSVILKSVNKVVKVPVTVYKFRVDTFIRTIENKAELAAKQIELDDKTANYNQQVGRTKTWQLVSGICGGLALLAIIALALIFRFK